MSKLWVLGLSIAVALSPSNSNRQNIQYHIVWAWGRGYSPLFWGGIWPQASFGSHPIVRGYCPCRSVNGCWSSQPTNLKFSQLLEIVARWWANYSLIVSLSQEGLADSSCLTWSAGRKFNSCCGSIFCEDWTTKTIWWHVLRGHGVLDLQHGIVIFILKIIS